MHKDVPRWLPHFMCYNRGCRKLPCLLNDACWFSLSVLMIVLLLTNTSQWW